MTITCYVAPYSMCLTISLFIPSNTGMGLSAPIGTGPFKFVSRNVAADGSDDEVVFAGNEDYWGQKPGIETLTAVQYGSVEEVEAALKSGDLDMAMGIGPLNAKQVQELKFRHSDMFDVRHSDVIQHSLLVFNGNKAPMNDIAVRRAVIHAIDKSTFIEEQFSGLEQPVTQLLPMSAPYCNVDLSPKWGYDLEKAELICAQGTLQASPSTSLTGGAVAGIVIASIAGVALMGLVARMIQRERAGKPMFAPTKTEIS